MCRCAILVAAKTDNTKPCARKTDCCQKKKNDKDSERALLVFVLNFVLRDEFASKLFCLQHFWEKNAVSRMCRSATMVTAKTDNTKRVIDR